MMITDVHADYSRSLPQWLRCRDAIEGSDAVKYRRETYLPRLPGQSDLEYDAYLMRAIWGNFARHVVDLYTGLVFSKDVEVEGLDRGDELVEDVDLAGMPIQEMAEEITEEVIAIGRYGVMVDYSGTITPDMTIADAERVRGRAFAAGYEATDIINWHEARRGGRVMLDRVVLHELMEETDQYRELILDEGGGLVVNVYRRTAQAEWGIVETTIPMIGGRRLDFVPFWFFDAEYGEPEPHQSPVLDVVDMNYSHYRTMADLEHGRFFCGIPTPVFAGFNFEAGDTVKLGGLSGIASTDPAARAYYLEFSGEGLSALERAAVQKEQWISAMGGGILDSDKASAETATAVRLRKTGANATLGSIAQSIGRRLSQVVTFMAEWTRGQAEPVTVALATEYMPADVTPQEISALMSAVIAGNFRRVDFLRRLKAGNILPPSANVEDIDVELPDPTMEIGAPEPAMAETTGAI